MSGSPSSRKNDVPQASTPSPDRLTLWIPQPSIWLNQNDRHHWRTTARRKKQWADITKIALQYNQFPTNLPPSIVESTFIFQRNARRDPMNFTATTKVVIDELVRWGCWPDDNQRWVDERTPHLTVGARMGVRLTITPKDIHGPQDPALRTH
jgi:hypothetical protein